MADEEKPATPEEDAKPAEAAASEGAPAATGEAKAEETAASTPAEGAAAATEAPKPAQADAKDEEGKGEKDEKKGADKVASADVFAQLDPTEGEKPKILKAKGSKNVHTGIVHVLATFNNTIVTITDTTGNVIGWSSAGKMGFRGSRKSTAYAAQLVSQDACRQAMGHGLKEAEVRVKGPGSGRESAVRAVQGIGIDITTIRDVTPVPHNGCRPPKPRRV
jgi:small subunit ribosomal protein S11